MALFDPKALPEEPPRWDLSPIVPEFAGLEDYPAKLKSKFDALADQLVADMQALQPLIDDMNARASGGQKLTVAEVMEPVARKKELGELSERYQTFFRLVYNEHYTDPAYSELQDYAHDRLNYAAFEGGKAMRSFQLPPSCVSNLVRQDPEIEKYRSLFEGDLRMREAYVAPSDRSTQQEQIDPRNVNVRKLFQAVNTSRELAADPKSHEDALVLLVNAKLYQEWQKAQQTGKSPDALAAEQSGLPDDFFQKMFTATPSLVDQQAYADAAQEVKDEAGLKGKLANTPKEKTFTWQEAAEAVVASFAAFHPEMGEIATRAFTENWIDGRNIPDKLHNNYSHYQQTSKTHAPMHPYISVHFDGSLKSVRALAHELGHAAADYLSGEETGNPISGSALHETYAHFAEALLMEHLVSSAKDPLEKADFRMSQFDRAMVAIVQSGMGALESMLYQATADETGHTPSLSAKEITGLMREAMHGVASPEALAKIPDLALLKQLGRYSQILVHDAFYNSSYPLAEMAAMHMAKEFKELGDSGKAEYADHWVKTMKLGSMLNYGRGMDAMGMNIGEPEALVVEAKETITGYMRELTAYVIEAEKPKGFAKRIDASREANAQHTR